MIIKVLNNGVVVSAHRDLREAEERVEMFKKFMPDGNFQIIKEEEHNEQVEQPQEQEEQVEIVELENELIENQPQPEEINLPVEEMINQIEKVDQQVEEAKYIKPKNYRLAILWNDERTETLEFSEKRDIERYINKYKDIITKAEMWNVRKSEDVEVLINNINTPNTNETAEGNINILPEEIMPLNINYEEIGKAVITLFKAFKEIK